MEFILLLAPVEPLVHATAISPALWALHHQDSGDEVNRPTAARAQFIAELPKLLGLAPHPAHFRGDAKAFASFYRSLLYPQVDMFADILVEEEQQVLLDEEPSIASLTAGVDTISMRSSSMGSTSDFR